MDFSVPNSQKTSPFLKMMEEKFGKMGVHPAGKLPSAVQKKATTYIDAFQLRKDQDSYLNQNHGAFSQSVKEKPIYFNHNHFSKNESSWTKMGWWEPSPDWLTVEFCNDTSLHGLKYIGQPKRHLSERIFWMIAFLCGLIVAIYLISDVWAKYNNNPVIVSFQSFETSVDQYPFPAVTVCNMNKILKSKAEEFLKLASGDINDPITKQAQKDVYYLEHICSVSKSFTKRFNYSFGRGEVDMKNIVTTLDEDLQSGTSGTKQFLRKASQNCSDMLPLCVWQDEIQNCGDIFRRVETEFGSCCTFNMVPQTLIHRFRNDSRDNPEEVRQWEQWNLDKDGYLLTATQNEQRFPRRQMQAGKTFGLSFVLNPNLKEYFCTTSDSVGFRMQVHLPVDVPHIQDFGIAVKPNAELFVDVKAEITMADKQIFGFPLKKRNCYYAGEFSLKYYSYYTSSNCIDECIANATFDKCNCVRFFMPRDDTKQLCGPLNFTCAEDTKRELIKNGVKNSCSFCLPTCSEMTYKSDLTATPLQREFNIWEKEEDSFVNLAPWSSSNVSIVHIFIGEDSTYARVRKELFGSTDLVANTGGLMGLCLGFSGLSLMEVIYFMSLRAWCRNRHKSHVRTRIVRKIQALWRKAKDLIMGHGLEDTDVPAMQTQVEQKRLKTSANNRHDKENAFQDQPGEYLTTVSINDEFSCEKIVRNNNHAMNTNSSITDFRNIFGDVKPFNKNH